MDYRVLVDSCVDKHPLTQDEVRIPFTVNIDGVPFVDLGETVIDQLNKIGFMAKSITTACPSPGDFISAIGDAKRAFIVTISSKLSGAHAAAVAAHEQIKERLRDACDVHIFDSKTACAGETMVAIKLEQLLKENLSVDAIVDTMTRYIEDLKTMFVLNSMDTLVANGRVKPIAGVAIKAMKICPIMGADKHGKIELLALARGRAKAFNKMLDMIGETTRDLRECVLGITHVNALEKAQALKEQICARYPFKDVLIFEAAGLSSVYASDGGIVLAY